MEPFLLYVIICIASSGGCVDVVNGKPWIFRSQRDCTVFAGKMLDAYREELKKKNKIFVDGTAFCLRYTETKGT